MKKQREDGSVRGAEAEAYVEVAEEEAEDDRLVPLE
jgi:hypothetical protein